MASDRMGTGIVGSKRQRGIAELLEHHQKVAGRTIEVLGDIMGVDTELVGGVGHELAEPDGSNRAARAGIVSALDLDVGAVEERPVGDRQTCLTQSVMTAVTQGGGLDGMEDFGGGADGARGDRCCSRHIAQGSIIPAGLRCCEEKETIWKGPVLGVVVTGERAQGARGLGHVDQSAIRADLEDETIGPILCRCGRGC